MEPFRIKMVEPLPNPTGEERMKILHESGYNPFQMKDKYVTFDLWSDSGTASMSQHQWAAMVDTSEGCINPESFDTFVDSIKHLTGFPYILPVHQGRAAEHILFSVLARPGLTVFSNTMYITGRTNAELSGAIVVDVPCKQVVGGYFNGDLDCSRLQEELREVDAGKAIVILTLTSNNQAGQPVSMANIKHVSEICKMHDIPLFMDGCRFAENAYFIKTRSKMYQDVPARDIALEMFSYFDGMYMSAKKDGLCNIGGFFATRLSDIYGKFKRRMIYIEGNSNHGGLSSRDMEAVARGLWEGTDDRYLKYRIESLTMFGDILKKAGVPLVEPVGSAIYINAAKCLPHIPTEQYPAWALHCALYVEGGIRCKHLHDVLKVDDTNERENPQQQHFIGLSIPRRTYTLSHLIHIGDVFKSILEKRGSISGVCIKSPSEHYFSAVMEPVRKR
ncbi:tryptophanase-like [Haliotis cracherodii]|uniref:tryptophanase-like n=1 Tax=Haliotis cracherodii TaxID=6455 RepID=UPI0039EC571A